MFACENSNRTAPESNGKLNSASAQVKKVGVSELCKIAPIASLGEIKILEAIARENSKRTAPGSNGKLTTASAHAKEVAVSDLLEIVPVASLGQIINIRSDRARIFKKESAPGATAKTRARENSCCL